MSVRLTIAKNGNMKVRTVGVIPKGDMNQLFSIAKNKLKLKKPSRVFDPNGQELTVEQFSNLKNDDVVVVSCGEDFVGTVKIEENPKHQASNQDQKVTVNILCQKSWVDDEAIKQLNTVANSLVGMVQVVGMPDLHAGRTFPVGASFASKGFLYPPLIGTDIGCGMSLYETTLPSTLKSSKIVNQLYGLESSWEGDTSEFLKSRGIETTNFDTTLGTIGGGNHFSEFQMVEKIIDEEFWKNLGVSDQNLFLLVHSGSRGLGEAILNEHVEKHGNNGLLEDTQEAIHYLQKHEQACDWAKANRALIASRALSQLGAQGKMILDIWHNNLVQKKYNNGESYWLHRKGAAPSDQGLIVIPGSRGSFSYLVLPIGDLEAAGYSLAHGAGRKWTRTKALSKMKERYHTGKELEETSLGSRVICEDSELIFEEAPQAYKDIEEIIQDLLDAKLIQVIAIFRPVVTYKTR